MRRYAAEGALVVAAFFYGVTFPLVHDALEDITPFAYLVGCASASRSSALAPFAVHVVRAEGVERRMLVRAGLVAGVLLFGGYATQTVGLQYTSPSTSAFITGLYVVHDAGRRVVVRRRPPALSVCGGIVVATVGLYLLTGADVALGRGELLTLGCAVLFAVWIVYHGAYANRLHPLPFTSAADRRWWPCSASRRPRSRASATLTALALFAVVFTGIACSAVALPLQLWGQRRIPPSRAALILLSEPVFAGIAGYVNGERLGAVELVGALVILAGIGVSELVPGRDRADAEDATAEAELEARLH